MSDAMRHPGAQTMAAFVEGRLPRAEIAQVASHLKECSECRTVVAETARFDEEERRVPGRSMTRWLAAAAAILVAALTIPLLLRTRTTSPVEQLIAASPRDHRLVTARLSGFDDWARVQAPVRGSAAVDTADLKLQGVAGEVIEQTRDRKDVDAQRAAGVAYLLIDRTAESIETLARAAEGSNDWRVWNDLAAARHAHAMQKPSASTLPQALAAVDQALRLEPKAAAARFNHALILEDLGLRDQAREAWNEYLALDPSSEWSTEAREHVQRLTKPSSKFDRKLLDTNPLEAVRRHPQESRRTAEGRLLPAWAEAVANGDPTAPAKLAHIRVIAGALVQVNGECFLADTVAAIDHADDAMRKRFIDAHRVYVEGRIALGERRPSDAEAALRRAAEAFGGTPMANRARYFAAVAAFNRNRVDEAHRELDALLRRVDASRHRALAADIQWQLTVWANMTGDWGAATRYAAGSAAMFRDLGETESAAFMDATSAMPLEILGETDLAWQCRRRTFSELNDAQVATALHGAAVTLASRGDTASALSFLDLLIRAPGADPSQLSYAYANRARFAARNGDEGRARASLASARTHMSGVPDPAVREKIFATIGLAEATMRSGNMSALDESIRFLTRGRTNIDLPDAYLQRARGRRAQRDDAGAERDLVAAMSEVEKQRVTIEDADARLRFLDVAAHVIEELIDLRMARDDVQGAFTIADRARVILDSAPASGGLKPAALHDTAIVEYAVLPRSIVAFCLTSNGLIAEKIDLDRRRLDALVASFADHVRGRRVSVSELRAESAELHRLLIAPLEKHVAGAGELVIVPDGRLHAIPFAALWDGERYLAEKYVLRFAPSAAFRRELKVANGPALVVADPPAVNLPPLRSSREEAAQIASLHGANVLDGEAATRAAFVDAAPRHALIHFAGHANSDATTSYGALLFAPEGSDTGALGSGEIARLRLRHHPLVVLAACGTFRGDPLHVSGMSSLSRAFLTAGARGVVGTLWEIDDDVSARVFLRFHEHLRTGMTPARALRAAQIDFRHSTDPRMQHPATWAPVALLTDV